MMRIIFGLALVAAACAQYSEYLPPTQDLSEQISIAPSNEYLAPVQQEQTVLADDGYRYKTVRRFRNRNRRDVSELTSAQYLPPQQELTYEIAAPTNEYLAPVQQQETVLADDGYRYKTVRRFRNRNRRDVSELTSAQYLPPQQELTYEVAAPTNEYLAPVQQQQETVLADDGYRYKTVRRFRNRNRRDVSELTSAQYLPPQQELAYEVSSPINEYLAPAVGEATLVADDGYRYKTVKKFKTRRH